MGSVDRTYDVAGLLLVIGALVVFAATAVVWYSGRVRDRESTERIAAARRDAATANQMTAVLEKEAALLRLDLEKERAKTGPRLLTKEQWDILQQVKGKVAAVNITYVHDSIECGSFAAQIQTALMAAGVKVIQTPAQAGFTWIGNMFAVNVNPGKPEDDPLVGPFIRVGLGGSVGEFLHSFFPLSPQDIPVVAIGERPLEYVTKPYFPGEKKTAP
jgi:hypothetical protein